MIRCRADFINNGEAYIVVHFRSPNDTSGNSHHAWVAFDIEDTYMPIAVSDTENELQGPELYLTVWTQKKKIHLLLDRMVLP